MEHLQVLDWALSGAAVFFAVIGIFRGFSGEAGSAAGWIAGATAAYFAWDFSADWTGTKWISFVFAAAASLFSFWLVRVVVSKLVNKALSQPTDAFVGFILGIVKIAAVVIALVHFDIGTGHSVILKAAESYVR